LATAFGHEGATWRQKFLSLADTLVDLVFPPVCASCKSVGELLCSACRDKIVWVKEPICDKCGRPLSVVGEVCETCLQQPLSLRQIRTATYYDGPVAEAIKMFKYEGFFALDKPLAALMLAAWPEWETPVDLVIPVPLHPARQRDRGYNQSEMLARKMAQHLDWQFEPAALKRVRHTVPQVGLNSAERQANVQGAFVTEPALIKGKHLLLIDDVRTTGATLIAGADVLLAAGAKSVSAYCLAGAGGDKDFSEMVGAY
jgi:ComF family protein